MLFENEPDHRVFLLIAAIWAKTRRWTEKQLKVLNITFPQFAALTALSREDGVTQRELSEVMDLDANTVMVVSDSLEKIKEFSIFNIHSSILWDGTDQNNQPVQSGIYFYKLTSSGESLTRKMLLLK